ncbi:hypothetical protein LWC05_13585 [Acetobacter sicerae]|uniref:Uncharacterized protein n=1 Tax=Acetobacter sicerae TaxID=85325 RepID=A0ABS8VV95_9PROT|nr:hypothetical protein [Acetobacter sicerae]MCE0744910.1 hypothetical protein [Acetobacter sicerae]NHN91561.1 hypothetical protein [Acetobacter sicerae]
MNYNIKNTRRKINNICLFYTTFFILQAHPTHAAIIRKVGAALGPDCERATFYHSTDPKGRILSIYEGPAHQAVALIMEGATIAQMQGFYIDLETGKLLNKGMTKILINSNKEELHFLNKNKLTRSEPIESIFSPVHTVSYNDAVITFNSSYSRRCAWPFQPEVFFKDNKNLGIYFTFSTWTPGKKFNDAEFSCGITSTVSTYTSDLTSAVPEFIVVGDKVIVKNNDPSEIIVMKKNYFYSGLSGKIDMKSEWRRYGALLPIPEKDVALPFKYLTKGILSPQQAISEANKNILSGKGE